MERNDLPEIVLTARDLSRLDLLTGFTVIYRTPAKEMLARELRRARLVATHELPPDVVTMHATLRYRDEETGAERQATLVYPGEEDRAEQKMSVLTPLGAAVLGLSAGQTIGYNGIDGSRRRVTVLQVLSQPGAGGGGPARPNAGRAS